jgi:hydroxymethylpyrimidine kinase/phosphomethylpyrimidine kinase
VCAERVQRDGRHRAYRSKHGYAAWPHGLGPHACSSADRCCRPNPPVGVQSVHIPPPEFVAAQLNSVLSDFPITVVKTGMLPNAETVRVVCDALRAHSSTILHVVVDPVLVSTSGATLAGGDDCLGAIRRELLPLATVVTPNVPEAARLLSWTEGDLGGVDEMRRACAELHRIGAKSVLVKGGHLTGTPAATDIFYDGNEFEAIVLPWIESTSTHGTGCTLASCIAAELANGQSVVEAVRAAKQYVHRAIESAFSIGQGHGPLHHMHELERA